MTYIYASGGFYHAIEDELPALKAEVKASCGRHIRRIDRFIQLAMIGSHRCLNNSPMAVDNPCSLYLASGDSPKSNTITALQQVFLFRQPLKPLQFINLVSNAAAFYIGQSLGIHGSSIFTSSPPFAIDNALHIAALDLADNSTRQALVGIVDECAEPVFIQREMLGLADNAPVGEGSYWFHLGKTPDNALAQILENRYFTDREQALAFAKSQCHGHSLVATGKGIKPEDAHFFDAIGGKSWHYMHDLARHSSATGYALHTFLQHAEHGRHLLHIDLSHEGHCNVLVLQRL